MADAVFMYGVTTGIFVFLVAVLFASRGTRKRHGGAEEMAESHSGSGSSSSGNEGKRIKKFKSDGTPVYE
jgi:hypothetical protein